MSAKIYETYPMTSQSMPYFEIFKNYAADDVSFLFSPQ